MSGGVSGVRAAAGKLDAAQIPGSAPVAAQARRRAPAARLAGSRAASLPGVRSGLGSLRGFAAGSLALIALEVASRRADQFGGIFTFAASLMSHAISPNVPAIPWLSKNPPPGTSSSAASVASSAAAVAPATSAVPDSPPLLLGLNPAVAYSYSAPLLNQQPVTKGA